MGVEGNRGGNYEWVSDGGGGPKSKLLCRICRKATVGSSKNPPSAVYEYYYRYPPLYECGRTINQADTWVRAGRGASPGNGQPRRGGRAALCLQIPSRRTIPPRRAAQLPCHVTMREI